MGVEIIVILRAGVTLRAAIAERTTIPYPIFLVMSGLTLASFVRSAPGGSHAGSRCQIRCDHEPVPCIKTRDRPALSGGRSARALPASINAWRICS